MEGKSGASFRGQLCTYVLLSASKITVVDPVTGISSGFSRKYSCEVSGTGNELQLSVFWEHAVFNPVVNNHCLAILDSLSL